MWKSYLGPRRIDGTLRFRRLWSALTLRALFRIVGDVSRVFGVGVGKTFLLAGLLVLTHGRLGCGSLVLLSKRFKEIRPNQSVFECVEEGPKTTHKHMDVDD